MTKITLNAKLIKDVFEWDRTNWAASVEFWNPWIDTKEPGNFLTLGEKHGGLSLLFALYGHSVTATDLEGVTGRALSLHKEYNVSDKMTYAKANMLEIPFENNSFDFIGFKSVLCDPEKIRKSP